MEKVDYQGIYSRRLERLTGRSADAFDQDAYMQRKLKTLLDEEGTLPGFRCEKCKNRGSIPYIAEDNRFVFRVCDCMDMRSTLRRMEESGLKNVLNNYTFGKFLTHEPWQAAAKQAAEAYARDPEGWFFIGGQSGSGKSHLCTAIARHFMQNGKRLVYMPWGEDAAKLKFGRHENKELMDLLENIKTAPVLYIDDFLKTPAGAQGRTKPSNADIALAFEIVNYRYLQDLPTVISSELYPAELYAIDEAMGGRIMECSRKNTLCITRGMEKDYRMKGVLEL